jgi:thiamine kinase-like enzyme
LKIVTNGGIFSLKVALYPKRKKKVLNEIRIRDFFITHGLSCIPAPIYSESEIFPYGAAIYEYVDGSPPDFKNFDVIKQLARLLADVHKIEYKIVDEGYTQIQKIYECLGKATERITDLYPHLLNNSIISAFSRALEEFSINVEKNQTSMPVGINAQLHGDLSNNFIIDSNKKIWLIDWENSEFGDIADEICWLFYVNDFTPDSQMLFFHEYQKSFEVSQQIRFKDITKVYFASYPVFDICWGIDQMATQIEHNLESPVRKLKDLETSAKEWSRFYSNPTSSLILDGIKDLKHSLLG